MTLIKRESGSIEHESAKRYIANGSSSGVDSGYTDSEHLQQGPRPVIGNLPPGQLPSGPVNLGPIPGEPMPIAAVSGSMAAQEAPATRPASAQAPASSAAPAPLRPTTAALNPFAKEFKFNPGGQLFHAGRQAGSHVFQRQHGRRIRRRGLVQCGDSSQRRLAWPGQQGRRQPALPRKDGAGGAHTGWQGAWERWTAWAAACGWGRPCWRGRRQGNRQAGHAARNKVTLSLAESAFVPAEGLSPALKEGTPFCYLLPKIGKQKG